MISTGVVSGLMGRLIDDCLQRIKTLWKIISNVNRGYASTLTLSPALDADIGASV
jgi:hypothetical protein